MSSSFDKYLTEFLINLKFFVATQFQIDLEAQNLTNLNVIHDLLLDSKYFECLNMIQASIRLMELRIRNPFWIVLIMWQTQRSIVCMIKSCSRTSSSTLDIARRHQWTIYL